MKHEIPPETSAPCADDSAAAPPTMPVTACRPPCENTTRFGISTQRIGGTELPVYDPAKTVADRFKYRNKIGIDVALEALCDCYCREQKHSRLGSSTVLFRLSRSKHLDAFVLKGASF